MRYFLHALIASWHSSAFYAQAVHQGTGRGVRLIGFIALGASLLFVLGFLLASPKISQYKQEIITQLPTFTLSNQQLASNGPAPQIITLQSNPFIVVDTRDESATQAAAQKAIQTHKAPFFIGRDFVGTYAADGEMEVHPYSQFTSPDETQTLRPEDIDAIIRSASFVYVPAAALFLGGFVFVYSLLQWVIYSALTGVIAGYLNITLDKQALQRLAACAMLPKSGLLAVFLLFPIIHVPGVFTIFLTLAFIVFGLKSSSLAQQRYS